MTIIIITTRTIVIKILILIIKIIVLRIFLLFCSTNTKVEKGKICKKTERSEELKARTQRVNH